MIVTTRPALCARLRTALPAPTLWGCTPREIHDRFWAASGVQVVRRGEPADLDAGADIFLLTEPDVLVLMRLRPALETMYWLTPALLVLRLADTRERPYRETAVEEGGRLVRFERVYRDVRQTPRRVALTEDREVALRWRDLRKGRRCWRALARTLPRADVEVGTSAARVYDGRDAGQAVECLFDLARAWRRPESTIGRARRLRPEVVADRDARIAPGAALHGCVLVGAGRSLGPSAHVVGPAVLWDAPGTLPVPCGVPWDDLDPPALDPAAETPRRARTVPFKRAFDVVFSLAALALTLPLYPFLAAAIVIEDGFPVFFAHRRETLGGREFPCLKFRSMRRGAERDRQRLAAANQADGPQFFVADDPRVTRVGRWLRRFHADELPQFLNVLAGHMSVVGPRPSPYRENQHCPSWREARLSVRPGITGLWQVSRSRRRGLDFQEWVRYDLEYVERAGWALDLKILVRTVLLVLRGRP